jgi:hypothetical protein
VIGDKILALPKVASGQSPGYEKFTCAQEHQA